MNLLLLTPEDQIAPGCFRITGRRAEHIRAVLRAKPGDFLKAGMLNGKIGRVRLLSCGRNEAELADAVFDREPPEKSRIVPVISLPRPQSFKKTLHFIVSSGLGKAFFVGSARVEKSYWKSSAMDASAIEEEIRLGLEQGVDTVPPELKFYPSLRDFFESEKDFLAACERRIVAHPEPGAPGCPHALELQRHLALGIGPEGGYTPAEVAAFQRNGFTCVTLGAHILRVEFALSVLCGKLSV